MIFKIRNIFIIALCLLYAPFRGRAHACKEPPRKVLVFASGKLGDIVCTTPVFIALKNSGAEVFAAANSPVTRPLLSDTVFVDGFVDTESFLKGMLLIRRQKFNACVITGTTFRSVALAFLSGIPCIAAPRVEGGHCPQYETKAYQIIKRFVIATPYMMGVYAPRERLNILLPLGVKAQDTTKRLGFSNPAKEKIDTFLKNQNANGLLLGIVPSAGNKIKEWPVERFAEVANSLGEKYNATILIVGGKGDKKLAEEMKQGIKEGIRVRDTTELFNIDELKAFISRLNMLIAVDTGPIYIAEAFNVPTVDIVGPIDEHEQPPIGERHKVVVPPRRLKPELYVLNARVYNKEEARRQAESISAIQVIEAANDCLQN